MYNGPNRRRRLVPSRLGPFRQSSEASILVSAGKPFGPKDFLARVKAFATISFIAVAPLGLLPSPAMADCHAATTTDVLHADIGRSRSVGTIAGRSYGQDLGGRGAVGLTEPNVGNFDPGRAIYGPRYGENYGGAPGSTNDQASVILGTPCGPPMTTAPVIPPISLTPPAPLIIAPSGALDAFGLPIQPGTLMSPNAVPVLPGAQTLSVTPWNPAESNSLDCCRLR